MNYLFSYQLLINKFKIKYLLPITWSSIQLPNQIAINQLPLQLMIKWLLIFKFVTNFQIKYQLIDYYSSTTDMITN